MLRCAVLARALDEPLAGTAPVTGRWLCLEQPGAWPQDIAAHRSPAVQELTRRAIAAGWRLLLIRRPGRHSDDGRGAALNGEAQPATTPGAGPDIVTESTEPPRAVPAVRVFLADTTPSNPLITTLTATPAELTGLVLPVDDEPLPGTPVTEPLLLVCTHGRHDRCCALDGRALVSAVTAGCPEIAPHIWESSHLGGHRFAPTALVLPTGYLYGRLDPATAIDVHKAAAHGEMEPLLCRGRSTWSQEGQIAELAVRRATGLREAAALHVGPHTAGEVLVTATDGRQWMVAIEEMAPPGTRPTTCGADPAPIAALRAGAVRTLAPLT